MGPRKTVRAWPVDLSSSKAASRGPVVFPGGPQLATPWPPPGGSGPESVGRGQRPRPPPHCPRLALAGRVGRDLGWPGATAECLAPRPTLCLSPPPTRPGCTKKLHRDPGSHLAPLPPPPAAPRGADLSRARRGAGSLSGAGPGAGPGGGASGSADPKPAGRLRPPAPRRRCALQGRGAWDREPQWGRLQGRGPGGRGAGALGRAAKRHGAVG